MCNDIQLFQSDMEHCVLLNYRRPVAMQHIESRLMALSDFYSMIAITHSYIRWWLKRVLVITFYKS